LHKEFINLQVLSVEEPFDELGEDSIPQRLTVLLQEDLTRPSLQPDYIPGKPLRVSGILKEMPILGKRGNLTDIDWILEANNCQSLEDKLTKTKFTPKEIAEFTKLSKDPEVYTNLIKSVAPHIYGHEKVKEAILLFLVRGVSKVSSDGNRTRDYFNILLMGDPGAAKSQLGNEITLLSWRAKKVVGKGSSGVGITASAEKDEVLNMRVLQAGAIPLCNEGHVVIDEVDKMDPDVQSHLHESMEDGTITINKSQVQGQLKARTAIFIIGNPKYGRYDPMTSIMDQIELARPLINRCDLIFPIKDVPTEDRDKQLAETILGKHLDIEEVTKRTISLKLLKNYICYVSLNIKPNMTKEAADVLQSFFLVLRNHKNHDSVRSVGITGRQLEGLVRMAEACAKLHMHNTVTVEDANRAIELMTYSLQSFGLDPKTGKVDIDRIQTGISASERSSFAKISSIIIDLDSDRKTKVNIDDIITAADKLCIDANDTMELLNKMSRTGDIMFVGKRFIQRI
jgi:replicative DNA helicase Mcm